MTQVAGPRQIPAPQTLASSRPSRPDALLRTSEPVNKFPDFVRYLVHRLQALCPRLGKVKIAQVLVRAGLHLAATSVGRMRYQKPKPTPPQPEERRQANPLIRAKYPNHLWHVDLTTVPTSAGFWTSWLPFALPQCWPFCWWLAIVVDHYSRRILGYALFPCQPNSLQVRGCLGRLISRIGKAPKHLVTDQGTQFTCQSFKEWCQSHDIRQRYGAVGQYGSIALVERCIRTLKESIRQLFFIPLRRAIFKREIDLIVDWYNSERPHMTLKGATPDEIYFSRCPANRRPRFEPRAAWPRASPCAKPRVLVNGKPGVRLKLTVAFVANRRHLPRVTLKRVA